MKKVLIITYYWPPSGGAGVQRSLKFVKYLSSFGIEPIVITVDPSQATYPIIDQTLLKEVAPKLRVVHTRSFEPLKILSAIKGKENVPHGGFANSNKESLTQKTLRFIRGNFFIPDARRGWVRFAVKAASEIIVKEEIDTVYISSPPHSSQLIGIELKEKYNVKWIADMRDPWTDIYYYSDLLHTKFSAARDAVYERKVLESADVVISVSDPINKMFLKKSVKLKEDKFHVIPNGFDEDDFVRSEKKENSHFQITYVGTMADNYNPSALFNSIKKLVADAEKNNESVKITMVGSSASAIRRLMHESGLERITEFISHVDHAEAIQYMQRADLLLLVIPDVENNEGILTGKLFEYLGAKVPVLGLGPSNGNASEILEQCSSGKLYERKDEEKLYLHMKEIYNNKKEGKKFFPDDSAIRNYSRRSLTEKLASLMK